MRKEVIFIVVAIALTTIVSAGKLAEISSIPEELIACENSFFSQDFEVTSNESEVFETDISPKDLFFVRETEKGKYELFSDNLTKSEAGKEYERTIYGRNSFGVNYKNIKIKVLERNNPPRMEDLGVETIALDRGTGFSKRIFAQDVEDGSQDNGRLEFQANFKSGKPIFEVSDFGLINFEADRTQVGVYLVEICVRDKGLQNLDANSGICAEDGAQKIDCKDFQLTVSEKDRPPTIISRSPSADFNTTSGKKHTFNLTTFDPDGTSPDVLWYVDGALIEKDSGISSTDKGFSYRFDCQDSGSHEIRADVTDGLIIDRVIWSIYVKKDSGCVEPLGEVRECEEKWACTDWNVCQHAGESAQFGTLPNQEYQEVLLECNSLGISQESCGYQIRNCNDIFSCGSQDIKPDEIQACDFGLSPSCSDNKRNCHSGFCEIAVDCGGSCGECPSCFDRIKNQNEERVDCGGVCDMCLSEETLARNRNLFYGAVLLIAILAVLLLYKLFRVIKTERELVKNE